MKKRKVSVIGLGYVGLPLAVSLARFYEVYGYDMNSWKVEQFNKGIDITGEVGNDVLSKTTASLSDNVESIKEADFHIIAVPTPINDDKSPNLNPVIGASKTVARYIKPGDIIVYESTVYPGVTEEICVPILEEISGLKMNIDFKVGYSPERINPGDKVHRLENIVKVVSGSDEESLEDIALLYESIIDAGVHRASSIKVAEAAKVIENSQRDINIAFMNELSIIFDKLGIDTKSVLEAAGTKWNFLKFSPGLVGGHCIGVDPYYLTYKAEQLGYHSQIILSGRKINDGMGKYAAEMTIKKMIKAGHNIKNSKIGIMGITFKEDCPDTRNTKVIDIVKELNEYGVEVKIYDPIASKNEVKEEYGIDLCSYDEMVDLNAIIFAVSHNEFRRYSYNDIQNKFEKKSKPVLIDLKGIFDLLTFNNESMEYWRF